MQVTQILQTAAMGVMAGIGALATDVAQAQQNPTQNTSPKVNHQLIVTCKDSKPVEAHLLFDRIGPQIHGIALHETFGHPTKQDTVYAWLQTHPLEAVKPTMTKIVYRYGNEVYQSVKPSSIFPVEKAARATPAVRKAIETFTMAADSACRITPNGQAMGLFRKKTRPASDARQMLSKAVEHYIPAYLRAKRP